MSLDDLLIDKKKKSTKKRTKHKGRVVKKATKPPKEDLLVTKTENYQEVYDKYSEDPIVSEQVKKLKSLGLDPFDLLIDFPDFDKWFRDIASDMPYFEADVKQADTYGKGNIKSHYFSFIGYFKHLLNKKD